MNEHQIKSELKRTIMLSQAAYQQYINGQHYYQAKRIYNANVRILKLLNEYKNTCEEPALDQVFRYIFHLEDWILQFEKEESKVQDIEQYFAFERLAQSFPFPQKFLKTL